MNYNEVLENARKNMAGRCLVCKECNGVACKGVIPGPGGKGSGSSFINNYQRFIELRINMDLVYRRTGIDTNIELFGRTFKYPFFAAPISAVEIHYPGYFSEYEYSDAVVKGCKEAGVLAFTGDGETKACLLSGLDAIKAVGGVGVPTIKPWGVKEVKEKIKMAEDVGAVAIAMDIDAAGLPILATEREIGPKPIEDLRELVNSTKLPFIVKGIMTPDSAERALEAGVYGIVVSNHGGRVLDNTPGTAEVLPEIAKRVGGKMKIFVDGGIRTGLDVFKALALGSDAVLIGRPYAIAAYGGGAEGVAMYTERIGTEFAQTMVMTGRQSLTEIDSTALWK